VSDIVNPSGCAAPGRQLQKTEFSSFDFFGSMVTLAFREEDEGKNVGMGNGPSRVSQHATIPWSAAASGHHAQSMDDEDLVREVGVARQIGSRRADVPVGP